jgi:hypothetical protein
LALRPATLAHEKGFALGAARVVGVKALAVADSLGTAGEAEGVGALGAGIEPAFGTIMRAHMLPLATSDS